MQEKFKAAAAEFAKVANKYPTWREKALFRSIEALIHTDEYDRTISNIEVFRKDFPAGKMAADALFLLALTLKKDGRQKAAEEKFTIFAQKFPQHEYAARALFEEGLLALGRRNYAAAIKAFTELCRKYPQNKLVPNTLYRRMFACFSNNMPDQAIADAEYLFREYSANRFSLHAQFQIANYLSKHKDYNKAINVLKKIAAVFVDSKEDAARAYLEIAEIYFKQKLDTEGLKALDELSEKFPGTKLNSDGLFLRGEIYAEKSEFEKAVPFFIKAAAGRP